MKHIPLTRGLVAIVDDVDYERVMALKWCAVLRLPYARWYAQHTPALARRLRLSPLLLHRFVWGENPPPQIDHRNGDGLDNRRDNLRACNNAQNQWNCSSKPHSSIYKGVSVSGRKWRAHIMANGVSEYLGTFGVQEDAAYVYDQAALRLFGEFARTNQSMGLLLAH